MIKDIKNIQHFTADEGKTFVNKETQIRYGTEIYLSYEDDINNYTEEDLTDEDKAIIENNNKVKEENHKILMSRK